MIYFHIFIYQNEIQMKTPEIQADPLLDLKAVQSTYKLNLHTIRTIVNDDTMPVIWLGKKGYLEVACVHPKGGKVFTSFQ